MQNEHSNNKFAAFWKTKGYYMALILCLAVVGVSGYLFVSGALEEQRSVEQQLSVPVQEADAEKEETLTEQTAEEVPAESSEVSAETETEPMEPVQEIVEDTVVPVSGTVVQDYAMEHLAYNPTTQDWRVHNGVDLAAPLGQSVKAARGGTVTAVFEDSYLGHTVVVRHSNGYTSHYSNLAAEVAVAAGDTVAAGQVLGAVGDSALIETAAEPHLHFEVYHNGEPVDPAGFLY